MKTLKKFITLISCVCIIITSIKIPFYSESPNYSVYSDDHKESNIKN